MKKKIGLCIAMTLGVIIAGAIAINTGINNQALAFDENSQLVEGEGNVAQHWHCENNQPVSVTVCPNPDGEGGTGGTSWHIYKTCKDQSDEWRSDAREPDNRYACHGPTTPRDLAGLSYPDGVVDVNDIYQQCADADWYVVFGYEATSGYHNQPNGQRDDTSMPGSVQIGPAKYNEGVAAFSEENTWDLSRRTGLAASPTNIADDSFGFPTLNSNAGSSSGYSDVLNNTHISELTAVSMFCGAYRTTTGKDDCDINTFKNSTGDNGMKGKGYFCVTDLTPNKVTIHIEKGDDGDKGETDCYGLSTGSEEAEIVDQSEQDTNSEKDIISWDEAALLESYTSDGWEIESVEGAEGATVNVAEGDAEVTYKLKKAGEEEGEEGAEEGESEGGEGQVGADKQCDQDCIAWAHESYTSSTAFHGETSVVMGLVNTSLTNENGEWHHMTDFNTNLKNGVVWAKPTDTVKWKWCYYPGAQKPAKEKVTDDRIQPDHPEPGVMHPTTNHLNNMKFMEYDDWGDSSYKVETEGDTHFENISEEYTVGAGVVKVDWGTLPDGGQLNNDGHYGIKPFLQNTVPPTDGDPDTLDPGTTKTAKIEADANDVTWADRKDDGLHTWQCNPHSCGPYGGICYDTCQHDDNYYPNERQHEMIDGKQKDNAKLQVPYNFINEAGATIQNEDPLYAGETVKLSEAYTHVGVRENEETQGTYATQVPNGKSQLVAFLAAPGLSVEEIMNNPKTDDGYGNTVDENHFLWQGGDDVCKGAFNLKFDVCEDLVDRVDGTLNYEGIFDTTKDKMGGSSYPIYKNATTFNVFDEAAGNQFCVAAAIYPYAVKNSGDEKDHDMDGTDDHWLISKPSCRTIAKKPTFQVWGSNMYSYGDIDTSISQKNNILADVHKVKEGDENSFKPWTYEEHVASSEVYFGSWVEGSLDLNGKTKTMASGASLGQNEEQGAYAGKSPWYKASGADDIGYGNPGGLRQSLAIDFCNWSALTMSNYGCKSGEVGGYEGETYAVDLKKEMEALKNQFELYAPGTEGYGTDPNLTVYKNQSLVNESNVEMGKTIVYISDGDIEINHDILYPTAGYQTIQQIPKMVIFAKNVNIGCNVQQLDALIWAEGNVSTCDGQTPITSDMAKQEKYKNQLVVNGAIVAGSITLNRAYGAGSGKDSLTPAELFNYDSSLYLWSYSNAEAANSGQMTETSLIELAPRY